MDKKELLTELEGLKSTLEVTISEKAKTEIAEQLKDVVSKIPLCVLSSLLMISAFRMIDLNQKQFVKGPGSDLLIFLVTLTLTLVTDLATAVRVGISLSLLFYFSKSKTKQKGQDFNFCVWKKKSFWKKVC